jgi:hypothetical protein
MKRNELEKSLQQNKMPCHLSLFISNILHANILSFATKMRRKLRQHTGRSCPHTGRHPVKSPKVHSKQKNHTHWKVCKIALNVLANMGAQTALNYAISAHRCSYLIALFHSSPKRLQLRHKDILPSPPSLNNSAQDKEKGEIKTSQRTVYWDESTIGSFGTRRTSSATSKWDPIENLESNENYSKIITQYHPHLPAIYCDDLSYIIR